MARPISTVRVSHAQVQANIGPLCSLQPGACATHMRASLNASARISCSKRISAIVRLPPLARGGGSRSFAQDDALQCLFLDRVEQLAREHYRAVALPMVDGRSVIDFVPMPVARRRVLLVARPAIDRRTRVDH